ncbi:MAG: hypothetical protein E7407_04825 [Ruminococcaceae bacterium]|nr:hypothetical protein [Oscillospiraceae bacterium]
MKNYIIKKTKENISTVDWEMANVADLNEIPWRQYPCPYETKAQILYSDSSLFVHLFTTETKLRAENNELNSEVSEDSCMEFFLSPDESDSRYFNFEINAIGTLLLFVCNGKGNYTRIAFDEKIFNIKTVITKYGWELFYEVPFSFMEEHFKKISKTMRGNFYKCGKKTVQRHYACWNRIELSEPEFHCPQFFGTLSFE